MRRNLPLSLVVAGFADLGTQVAETSATTVESLEEIKPTLGNQGTPRLLTVYWAPDWPRKSLKLLGQDHPR